MKPNHVCSHQRATMLFVSYQGHAETETGNDTFQYQISRIVCKFIHSEYNVAYVE
jgi:hypothetical protein